MLIPAGPRPRLGWTGEVILANYPLVLVPGTYQVSEPERFGTRQSVGSVSYASYAPYEQASAATRWMAGFGLRRYSDEPDENIARAKILEGTNADTRGGLIHIASSFTTETLPSSSAPVVWLGEYTTLAGTKRWVAVAGTKVYYRNADGTWTDTGLTLPAAARQGAVGVFGTSLIFGFGSANVAKYTNDLATLGAVTTATGPANLFMWAITVDRAVAYGAVSASASTPNTVSVSTDGVVYVTATAADVVKCGSPSSEITSLAPGGGVQTVFVGKETELGLIDNNSIYRVTVPLDTKLTTNCFPGDTPVSWSGEPQGIMRRWYDGEVVEITTASGRHLTGTPNHPVATRRGWVPLGTLNEGDDAIVSSLAHTGARSSENIDHTQPTLQQLFEAAQLRATTETRCGGVLDFHGDGQAGEVEIVPPPRDLLLEYVPTRREPTLDLRFESTDLDQGFLFTDRSSVQLVGADPAPPGGISDRSHDRFALSGGQLAESQALGLTGRPDLNTKAPESTQHDRFRGAVTSSKLSCTVPRQVRGHELGGVGRLPLGQLSVGVVGAHRDTEIAQRLAHRGVVNSVPGSEDSNRCAGQVALDRVVRVRRKPYVGHVYNLQTTTEDYFAGGILAHNCRGMRWWLGRGDDEQRGPLMLVFPRDRSPAAYVPSNQGAGQMQSISPWGKPTADPPTIKGIPNAFIGTTRWLYYSITNTAGQTWIIAHDMQTSVAHAVWYRTGVACNALGITNMFSSIPYLFAGNGNDVARTQLPFDGDLVLNDEKANSIPLGTTCSVDFPYDDGGLPDEDKVAASVRVISRNATATNRTIAISYDLEESRTYLPLGTAIQSPHQELVFPSGSQRVFKRLGLRAVLTSSSATNTPVLVALVLRYFPAPKLYRFYSFAAMLPAGSTPLGPDDLHNAKRVMDDLWDIRMSGVPTPFYDRWGDFHAARIIELGEKDVKDERERVPETQLLIKLLETIPGSAVPEVETTVWYAPTALGGGMLPLALPWNPVGYGSYASETKTVTNPGTLDQYPLWHLYGQQSYVSLVNTTTGKSLTLQNIQIPPGGMVTIDPTPGRQTVYRDDGEDLSGFLAAGSEFWALAPGDNTITATQGGTHDGARVELLREIV